MDTDIQLSDIAALLQHGIEVIEARPGEKIPLHSGWQDKSTSDFTKVVSWLHRNPKINFAIKTGSDSGMFVVDLDVKPTANGLESIKEFSGEEIPFDFKKNMYAKTPSGGYHLYFKLPSGVTAKQCVGALDAVDIRGEGGLAICAPSSYDVDGTQVRYTLCNPDGPIAEPPDWVIQLLIQVQHKASKQKAERQKQSTTLLQEIISGVPEGSRDEVLFKFACSLRSQGIAKSDALSFVRTAAENCSPAFDTCLAEEKVHRVYSTYPELSDFEYTDWGNSKRWSSMFSKMFKWVAELKTWFRWTGFFWAEDIHGGTKQTIEPFLQDIHEEKKILEYELAEKSESDSKVSYITNRLEECSKWYKQSQGSQRISSTLDLAKTQPGVSISFNEFDSKGHYLGTNNGVLKLTDRSFSSNDPAYLITKHSSADYDPAAECPNWIKFLGTTFGHNQNIIKFVQRIVGQCLLGTDDKSTFFIFSGAGANGKSTLVDTLKTLLADYACVTSAQAITHNKTNKEYYLATLIGIRLVIINETQKGARLDEAMVKLLVDSGIIQARRIYSEPISFQPVCTPILVTNYPPHISADYSINRRLLFVPFEHKIPEADRDPLFRQKYLEPELSGILNWALEGCADYLQQGLNPPDEIVKATKAYIFENDKVSQFISECCTVNPHSKIESQELYKVFLEWCDAKGCQRFGQKRMNQELRSHDFEVERSTGGVFYVFGLNLKQPADQLRAKFSPPDTQIDPRIAEMTDLD